MISGSLALRRGIWSSAGASVMPGRVGSDGVTARERRPGRGGASDVVEMVDAFDDLRGRLGRSSGALGALFAFNFILAEGRESRIFEICSSRGMDGETGDFCCLVGEAGIVGREVSKEARSWSEMMLEFDREPSPLRFFIARLSGGGLVLCRLARTEGDSSPASNSSSD